jgi:hypothetical protein
MSSDVQTRFWNEGFVSLFEVPVRRKEKEGGLPPESQNALTRNADAVTRVAQVGSLTATVQADAVGLHGTCSWLQHSRAWSINRTSSLASERAPDSLRDSVVTRAGACSWLAERQRGHSRRSAAETR